MGAMNCLCSIVVFSCVCNIINGAAPPNIVFILTDDQDVVLNGLEPVAKARKLIGDAGITFSNMFVTSPLCCPSRSSILTGNYVHNHRALNNSITGNCSSPQWQANSETRSFPVFLKKQGYSTFFAGKYLNEYGFPETGGTKHIPPGWDWWTGLVGNSAYYDYSLSINGTKEKHGMNYTADYLTDLIGRHAQDFLSTKQQGSEPFFMMLATPACHAPFTPAPQYKDKFPNVTAPRNGSFNKPGKDKHWLMRQVHTPMANTSLKYIDETYANRWRTLLSVDDIVEQVVNTLEKKKLLDSTYVFFSSDNGFHLGQFSLPNDKRQMYEFDIRVPLMVRGPGIKPGQKREEIMLNIDFAPTFVDLAGVTPPSTMDGLSMRGVLLNKTSESTWRTDFMVEHWGEYQDINGGCPQWNYQNMTNCFPDCVCEDAYNNTYACVRTISQKHNTMYCEFSDDESFVEVYDLAADPHQMSNIVHHVNPEFLVQQNKRLISLSMCTGPTCRKQIDPWPPVMTVI